MITHGSAITLEKVGPWVSWVQAGNPDADPYTRAHFARSNQLPITSTSARYYVAKVDSAGSKLDSDCEYVVSGPKIDSSWWSLSAYDKTGKFLSNKAERYAFNKYNISSTQADLYTVTLAPYARPGNWLPLSGGDSFQLVFRIYLGEAANVEFSLKDAGEYLPDITRVDC